MDKITQDYKKALTLHKNKEFDQAATIYRQLIQNYPDRSEFLYLLGDTYLQNSEYSQAIEWMSQAVVLQPSNITFLTGLGNALIAHGKPAVAIDRFLDVLRLQPDNVTALTSLGHAYFNLNEFHKALIPLNHAINFQFNHATAHELLRSTYYKLKKSVLLDTHSRIYNKFAGLPQPNAPIQDTFFLDRKLALKTALQKNRFSQTIAVDATQLCYHSETPYDDAPPNLIQKPLSQLSDFFLSTRLRWPTRIDFDLGDENQSKIALKVAQILDYLPILSTKILTDLTHNKLNKKPKTIPGEPLRVFLAASRLSVVMQYSSRGLAEAFKKLGCTVKFIVEENDMEGLSFLYWLKEQWEFDPHIIININHLNNDMVPHDVYNIVWWQDPMPKLIKGEPLPWRERDIVLSAIPYFDPYLKACGVKEIHRQTSCVQEDVFRSIIPMEERKKVVFVGSSYINEFEKSHAHLEATEMFLKLFNKGEEITDDYIDYVGKKTKLDRDRVLLYILSYVHRDIVVEWLCELAPKLDLEVEIYGLSWENNKIVAPFYKGRLYGADVAKVYNEAKFGLSNSYRAINSQRLAEIAACGCIPIVQDNRYQSEKPHWDDEVLFFKLKKDLLYCLTQSPLPKGDPMRIANECSYTGLAKRILKWVSEPKP